VLEQLVRERGRALSAARTLPASDLLALIRPRRGARHLSPATLDPKTPAQQAAWQRTLDRNLELPFQPGPAPAAPLSPPAQPSAPVRGQLGLFDHAARRLSCIRDGLREAHLLLQAYEACGARPHADGAGVDRCVERRLKRAGYQIETAARTSADGDVEIYEVDGPCAALDEKALRAHEAVHERTQRRLAKQHGAGTRAFDEAWNDATRWAKDEIAAYKAQARVYERALGRSG
jgi:hypothetical protein